MEHITTSKQLLDSFSIFVLHSSLHHFACLLRAARRRVLVLVARYRYHVSTKAVEYATNGAQKVTITEHNPIITIRREQYR